jgi:voltage-gated potassium channel
MTRAVRRPTVDHASGRAVAASIARSTVGAGALFAAFVLAPFDVSGDEALGLRLAASVIIPAVVLTLQILAVGRSPYPWLRAVEAVAISFPLLIFLFASTYYAMDLANPDSFNEAITRTDAIYLTVTIFATVGFGDIVATSQLARIGVTIQMIADMVLIGFIARVLLGTIQRRRAALQVAAPGPNGNTEDSST